MRGHLKKGYVYEIKEKSDFSSPLPINDIITNDVIIKEEIFIEVFLTPELSLKFSD